MADGPSSYGTARSADVAPGSREQSGGMAAAKPSSSSESSSSGMAASASSGTASSAGTAHLADIAPALREQAEKVADMSLASGVDAAHAVGKAAESAAQALDDALPMLAGYVRNAAQYTDKFADSLRDKKAEELLSTAVTWSRQQPLLTLAGAAVLGFALSRIAKSAMPAATSAAGSVVDYATGSGVDYKDLPAERKDASTAAARNETSGDSKPAHSMSALGGGNAG